jgi:hypothetical protein
VGRLAAGAGPQARLGHRLDHRFAVQRLLAAGQDLRRGVERPNLLGFRPFGLLGDL